MRRPLAWLILLEIALVAALATATYEVIATRWHRPPATAAAPSTAVPRARPPGTRPAAPRPPLAAPTPAPRGPAPGLSTDPAFWNQQLQRVNSDQSELAALQARAVRAVTDWVRAYVDGVLLPAVREAEKK
jgi:hypothetical protein